MKNCYYYFKFTFTLLVLFAFTTKNADATHVSGGDITYRCLGNNEYEITLNLFRDCSGASLSGSSSISFSSPCGNFSANLSRISISEVSQLCDAQQSNSRCNGGNLPGMQHHIYRTSVTLPPCDTWRMSYELCCRNSTANVSGQPRYYVESFLDNSVVNCNNSPVFTSQPIPYNCVGQPIVYNYGVVETDGDSLVYSLVDARSNAGTSVPYTGGASGTSPVPGITLNTQTGLLNFTPNNVGFYIVVVQVDEYRNGVLIGSTKRDMQFVIQNCSNIVPTPAPTAGGITIINGNATTPDPYTIQICENVPFTFEATFDDPDVANTLTLTSNIANVLPGAVLTTSGTNPLIATVSWVPGQGSANSNTSFSITIRDDACPITGFQTFIYDIQVQPTTFTQNDTTICIGETITLNTFGGSVFNWFNMDGTPITPGAEFSCNPCQNPDITPSQDTSFYVVSNLANGCVFTDTVSVTVLPNLTNLTPQNDYCVDAPSFTLTGGTPLGGTYSGPGVSGGIFTPSAATPGIHDITYTYFDGTCSFSDVQQIEVFPLPTAPIIDSVPPFCCGTLPSNLTANVPGGVWSGVGIINTVDGTYNPSCDISGTHVIDYEITDVNGCKNTGSQTVVVLDELIADAGPDQFTGFNTSVAVSGNSTTGGAGAYTYNWTPPSLVNNATVSSTPTSNLIQTTVFTLTVTDGEGCTDTDNVIVSIIGGPLTGSVQANPTNVCGGQPVDLLAIPSGGAPPYSFTWIAPTGNTLGTSNSVTVNPLVTTTYTVEINDNNVNNPPVTASVTVTVGGGPTAVLDTTYTTCLNTTPFLLEGGLPLAGIYSGDGVYANTFYPDSAGIGTHSIVYTVTDLNGCIAVDSTTIEVFDIPTPTLDPFSDLCLNDTAQILTGGLPLGGEYFGSGVIPVNVFNPIIAGVNTHTIFYNYTDSNGCSNSASETLTVNGVPNVTLDTSYSICIYDSPVTLADGAPAGGIFSGPGISGNIFVADSVGSGLFDVTYTYTDANGCSNSATTPMQVNPSPIITISTIPPVCIDEEPFELFLASPSGGGYTGSGIRDGSLFVADSAGVGTHILIYDYINEFGCESFDTASITVVDLPQITNNPLPLICINDSAVLLDYAQPSGGDYTGIGVDSTFIIPSQVGVGTSDITYTFTDSLGCVNSDTVTLTVNDIPTVTFDPLSNICVTEPEFPISGGFPNGGTYSGTGVNNNNFDAAISGDGNFLITYTFTDTIGCSNTDTSSITVEPLPILTVSPLDDVCENDNTFTLNNVVPTGGTYSGAGVTNNEFSPNQAGAGTFFITYTYTLGACTTADSTDITVNPNPVVNVFSIDSICINDSALVLDQATPPGGTYSGLGVFNNVLYPDSAGFGTITLSYTFTDNNNCSTTEDFDVIIENIFADFVANPIEGIEPLEVEFANFSENGNNYFWDFGDGGTSNDFEPNYTFLQFGDFDVMLVATSPKGCVDTAIVSIFVEEYTYNIPNVFSPNGDGQNDLFKPYISGYKLLKGEIFNRWGKKMYEWENPNEGWDGTTLSGGNASDGTYFYIISIEDINGNSFTKNGTINLFR